MNNIFFIICKNKVKNILKTKTLESKIDFINAYNIHQAKYPIIFFGKQK